MPRPEEMPPTEKAEKVQQLGKELDEYLRKNLDNQHGFASFVLEKLVEFEFRLKQLEEKE